jgi:hypothetical protein
VFAHVERLQRGGCTAGGPCTNRRAPNPAIPIPVAASILWIGDRLPKTKVRFF